MGYTTVLFDLDGTLTDSAAGIINSVRFSLNKLGASIPDSRQLYRFVGPPLLDSFMNFCGFSEKKAQTAIEYYREYYRDNGIFENAVYNGMEDVLKTLKSHALSLMVATSKPQHFAEIILKHYGLTQYFDFLAGSNLDGTRVKKGEVIQYVLDSCHITDLSHVIMVGDRKHDIIGAKQAGIASLGVLYGYGGKDELERAGADYLAHTTPDIASILLPPTINSR